MTVEVRQTRNMEQRLLKVVDKGENKADSP